MTDKFDSLLEDVYASLIVTEKGKKGKEGQQLTPLDQITPAAQRLDSMGRIAKTFAPKNLKDASAIKKHAKEIYDGPVLAKLNTMAKQQVKDMEDAFK